jgi:hypothetical protein
MSGVFILQNIYQYEKNKKLDTFKKYHIFITKHLKTNEKFTPIIDRGGFS